MIICRHEQKIDACCVCWQVKACKTAKGSCSCHGSVGVVEGDGGGAAGLDAQGRALSARDVFNWPAEIPLTRQPQLLGRGAPVVSVIRSYGALLRLDPHTTLGTRVEVMTAFAPEAQQVKVRQNCERCCVRKTPKSQRNTLRVS